MKTWMSLFLIFFATACFGQNLKSIDKSLQECFQKIDHWAFNKRIDDKINTYDSLDNANQKFEKLLVKFTSSNPETIAYNFKNLSDSGLRIATSADGLFRIYSWDTWTGGSMHIFKNVFQYRSGAKVYSKVLEKKKDETNDPGCTYTQVNEVPSAGKKYYLAQSIAVLSSALSYQNIKVFSIEESKLNADATLIKTRSGIRNQLGYEADLSAGANRNKDVPDYGMQYDKENKIISIPVILDNSEITSKRIRYQFKGKYFEKL